MIVNKIFNIFEHDYIYGLCFKEKEIIMEELRVCMDGYAKYRPQDSMIQIVPMKNFRNQPIIENNAINRITFWEIVKASIHNLERQDSSVLVELLSSYVKCKKAKLVIAQLNVVEMEAIKKASILMALIAKYEKTNKMKHETFDYCKKLVNELFSLECE